MPPDTKSVEEIVKGLDKFEKQMLSEYSNGEWHWTPYGPVTQRLHRLGLVRTITHDRHPSDVRLTQLGRAVAAVVGEG